MHAISRLSKYVIPIILATTGTSLHWGASRAAAQIDLNRFESTIQAFERADREEPPTRQAVLFVGSSSVRGWKTLARDMAPLSTINRGFGGSTFPELIHYADRIILPYQPKCIVIYEGDNDIASGATPQKVLSDMRLYQEKIQQAFPGILSFFLSIKPSIRRKALLSTMQEANRLIADYAASQPTLEFVDVSRPMLTPSGDIRSDIFLEDDLHLNAHGYRIWTSVLKPALEKSCGP